MPALPSGKAGEQFMLRDFHLNYLSPRSLFSGKIQLLFQFQICAPRLGVQRRR